MRLRFKQISLESGTPIAFVSAKIATRLNVIQGSRIEVFYRKKKLVLPVNLADKLLAEGEIAFSQEATDYLGISKGQSVNVSLALEPRSTRFIFKKLEGKELTKVEISAIINDIVNNSLNEAEIAYFVSANFHYGMSFKETIYLTEAMAKTGEMLSWGSNKIADKHSIGGIPGNRTTPIVVSICAAAGIIMPKTSSRAITTAAATADVMESMTNVYLSTKKLKEVVRKTNACIAWGGSLGLAPADDKLIRVEKMLNVDPESQLIASIMAKKIAAGSKFLLLDIPYGVGAKVSLKKAKRLRKEFTKVARHFGIKIRVILTDGSQPIGNSVGPNLEAMDIYKILRRQNPPRDLEEKAIHLSSEILEMMGKAKKGSGRKMAQEILDSGKALKKFEEIISAQGKSKTPLRFAKFSHNILSQTSGKVIEIKNRPINLLAHSLGCPTNASAGLTLHKHVGDSVKKGEPILTLYAETKKELEEGVEVYKELKPYVLA